MASIKFLFKYLKRDLLALILCIIFSIILVISLTLIPYYIGLAIDQIDLFNSGKILNFDLFTFDIILISLFIALTVIFQFVFDFLLGRVVERVSKELRDDLFLKFNAVPISFIDNHLKGDLISRIVNDVDNVNTGLTSFFRQLIIGIFQVIIMIVMMFYVNYLLAIVVILLTPFGFLLSYIIAKKSSKYYKENNRLMGEVSSNFLEYINNIDVVESYNYEEYSFNKFNKINQDLYKVGQKAQLISSLINPSSRVINNSITAVVVILGAFIFILASSSGGTFLGSTLTAGMISTFIQYSIQYSKPFDAISSCVSEAQNAYSSLNRILYVMDSKNDVDNGKEVSLKRCEIAFNNVDFSYDNNRKIIDDFSLLIKEGYKIALVGPTGCGKTTIINLLLRFYDPNKGTIDFNKEHSVDIKKETIRAKFGMVLQDTWIFKGSVLENIAYSKEDATFEEIKEAARNANCLDFIERLPQGFDTIISDNSGLSVGEKQLISIARVMLMKPEILLLDEATSNIDTRTELKIVEAINRLCENKTSIMVAHRLSTIINSDFIVVINNGKIIESGNHKELMAKKGFYFNLYNAQFEEVGIK